MTEDIIELIQLAKAGTAEAFGKIYDIFAQKIFKYIRLKVQDRAEAEDILQEVFVKAYQGLPKLNLTDLNFSAWLYKVAGNTVNDHFRKKYRSPEITPIDEKFDIASSESVQKNIEVSSDIETVQIVFNQLSPIYRQVLELRFVQEFTLEETAKVIGKSNLAVRLIQFRALKKVKEILSKSHKE